MLLSNLNAQNHFYRQYTIDDGLPTNYVYGATQDTLGNIWVYTENGICQFDGYTFKTFTTDDGLPNNDAFWMVMDKTGKMWVLTLSWTVAYINEKNKFIELDSLGTYERQYQILDGKLMLGKDSTYVKLCGDNINIYEKIPFDSNLTKYFYFQTNKHTLYIVNKENILKNDMQQYPHYAADFDLKIPISIAFGNTLSTGKFYFGAIDSEFYIVFDDSKKDQRVYWFNHYFDKQVQAYSISHLNNKKKILETNNGYLYLDSTYAPVRTFAPSSICNQYFMMRYFEDKEGNIWLGSKNGGLFQIPYYAKETEVLKVPPESSKFLFKILETENGIYPVSKEGDIYIIKNHQLHLVKQLDLDQELIGALPINKNEILFAERRNAYVYQLNPNSVKPFDPKAKNSIYHLTIPDRTINEEFLKGNRAIAYNKTTKSIYSVTYRNVLKFNQSTDSLYLLSEEAFNNVFVLGENDIFFIKGGSLYKEVNNKLVLLKKKLGTIITIYKTDTHHYLIGTRNKGIYLFNEVEGSFITIDKLNHVRKFYPYNGRLYIACDEGIIVYEQKERLNWKEVKRFDTNIGLPSLEVLDIVIKNDTVYAATNQGLAVFNVHLNPKTKAGGSLQIQYVYVNGDTLKQLNKLQLNHKQNNLIIAYHLQHYGSNGQIQYAYQLEPLDTNWRTTKERIAQYARLQPGDYRFRLKAKNFLDDEYQLMQVFNFTITKAYWQNWWFIALFIVALGGSLGWIFYILNKQAQLKKESEEKELLQQIAELKMESLRSQMNPHFIYNALGSIQYYIQDHKIEEADEYLALFAQLMRRYLDSAVDNVIKLKDELQLLSEYTELEEMRFETKFITKIEVDTGIYPADEWIPSMLIQPFVENAINHGLQKRESGGLLHIKFWKINEDELVCEISDNGIGVVNSKKNKRKGHKSRAMKNVQDRLEVFQNTGIANVKITTSNISKDINYPGTKVKLQFINFNKYEELQLNNN